jgi:long-chain fatty acid transport protein
MGGAYAGVSDDASGVRYNPGGLAFAQSNDISGSANAFYSKTVTYKKAISGSDWVENSGGTFAPFFGALQKLDSVAPGLVGGFAYYTVDTQLTDQEKVLSSTGKISRYHRAANQRASTWIGAAAIGYRVSSSLGIGLSLGYQRVDELVQISQNLTTTDSSRTLMRSDRTSLSAHGIQSGLGLQWAPATKWSIGVMAKTGQYASQKYASVGDKIDITGGTASINPEQSSSKKPLGSMPLEVRAGAAYFASPKLLLTSDIEYHAAVEDSDTTNVGTQYVKDSVINYAFGSEYYVTPSTPIRFGVFTNNDATPDIDPASTNQPDHIDYIGTTLFAALAQPNSQVSAGVVVQSGKGKSQKIGGSTDTQDVAALAYTLGFSATHSF